MFLVKVVKVVRNVPQEQVKTFEDREAMLYWLDLQQIGQHFETIAPLFAHKRKGYFSPRKVTTKAIKGQYHHLFTLKNGVKYYARMAK